MKKLLLVLLLGVVWVGKSEAAGAARGAKGMAVINYTTQTLAISSAAPAALYQVILSSGAAGEYIVLFDSASAAGLTSVLGGSTQRARLFFSSATALTNMVYTFDPPLQFNNGIMAIDSAATGQALFTYEKGRVTQGY